MNNTTKHFSKIYPGICPVSAARPITSRFPCRRVGGGDRVQVAFVLAPPTRATTTAKSNVVSQAHNTFKNFYYLFLFRDANGRSERCRIGVGLF